MFFNLPARAPANAFNSDRPTKRRPFSSWVKKITNFKHEHNGSNNKKSVSPLTNAKNKKNNPYPESGHLQRPQSPASSVNGHLSYSTPTTRTLDERGSATSIPRSDDEERESHSYGYRSGAPTVATNPETIHSDAGHSKAATTATGAGALSSLDGAREGSTFSSPNQSVQSLTTTLTTIQSQAAGHALSSSANSNLQNSQSGTPQVMFSHQYPVASQSSGGQISAIPRHVAEAIPTNYSSATANNLLSDNASLLTLASSSKRRRRRSMDTDASVRAIPPSSVWGGSRESLPLSVLSGADTTAPSSSHMASQSRRSIGGLANAERTSIYSSQGISAPALASERNSYYAASHKQAVKDFGDTKSLRSVTNADARSQYDARSITDAKSMDVGSLRGYEGSVRSGAVGHNRNDSIPGSISSPLASPGIRQPIIGEGLHRRDSDRQDFRDHEEDHEHGL
ncbi:Hypothetical protein R9X50_00133500 [Acrodontium crateriforme]|uniref:Uncharacterized protein n=1 Tax=Acrodontium crateriforme TaxID=150365 RepID=A0AAQ3R5R2_9PEZI|nr:Hypothetical protein R9X50_00133500 [Acrodontium crateriforme]